MSDASQNRLDSAALQRILDTTRRLARPIDLATMLGEVIDAAREVLDADRGTVFLHDPERDELVVTIGTGLETLRLPAGRGIVGECVQQRRIVNVPDCYADPRFNPEVDRRTGYRTRCTLTVPLVGHDDSLVGALQILNKHHGLFDERDERIAAALGAQCAVALQRAQMLEAYLAKERMDRELAVAREIQSGFLPRSMPEIEGYELAGFSRPATEAGGDTYDLLVHDNGRVTALVGDATGHGVGPALSANQVRSMLRIAERLGADPDETLRQINEQLCEDLTDNRFVTAFVGTLDPAAHRLRYHSAGQAPILHYAAADRSCRWLGATSPPLGMLSPLFLSAPVHVELQPGDLLAVMTDGVYENATPDGEWFEQAGVERLLAEHAALPVHELGELLYRTLAEHRRGAAPDDDITMLWIRRLGV